MNYLLLAISVAFVGAQKDPYEECRSIVAYSDPNSNLIFKDPSLNLCIDRSLTFQLPKSSTSEWFCGTDTSSKVFTCPSSGNCPAPAVLELDEVGQEFTMEASATSGSANNCVTKVKASSGLNGKIRVKVNVGSSNYFFFTKDEFDPVLKADQSLEVFPVDWDLVIKWSGTQFSISASLERIESVDDPVLRIPNMTTSMVYVPSPQKECETCIETKLSEGFSSCMDSRFAWKCCPDEECQRDSLFCSNSSALMSRVTCPSSSDCGPPEVIELNELGTVEEYETLPAHIDLKYCLTRIRAEPTSTNGKLQVKVIDDPEVYGLLRYVGEENLASEKIMVGSQAPILLPADWELLLKWSFGRPALRVSLLPIEGFDDPILSAFENRTSVHYQPTPSEACHTCITSASSCMDTRFAWKCCQDEECKRDQLICSNSSANVNRITCPSSSECPPPEVIGVIELNDLGAVKKYEKLPASAGSEYCLTRIRAESLANGKLEIKVIDAPPDVYGLLRYIGEKSLTSETRIVGSQGLIELPSDWELLLKWSGERPALKATLLPIQGFDDQVLSAFENETSVHYQPSPSEQCHTCIESASSFSCMDTRLAWKCCQDEECQKDQLFCSNSSAKLSRVTCPSSAQCGSPKVIELNELGTVEKYEKLQASAGSEYCVTRIRAESLANGKLEVKIIEALPEVYGLLRYIGEESLTRETRTVGSQAPIEIPADWELLLKWSGERPALRATYLPIEGFDDPVLSAFENQTSVHYQPTPSEACQTCIASPSSSSCIDSTFTKSACCEDEACQAKNFFCSSTTSFESNVTCPSTSSCPDTEPIILEQYSQPVTRHFKSNSNAEIPEYCPLKIQAPGDPYAKIRIEVPFQDVPIIFFNRKAGATFAKIVTNQIVIPADWKAVVKWSNSLDITVTLDYLEGPNDPVLTLEEFPTSVKFMPQEECKKCISSRLSSGYSSCMDASALTHSCCGGEECESQFDFCQSEPSGFGTPQNYITCPSTQTCEAPEVLVLDQINKTIEFTTPGDYCPFVVQAAEGLQTKILLQNLGTLPIYALFRPLEDHAKQMPFVIIDKVAIPADWEAVLKQEDEFPLKANATLQVLDSADVDQFRQSNLSTNLKPVPPPEISSSCERCVQSSRFGSSSCTDSSFTEHECCSLNATECQKKYYYCTSEPTEVSHFTCPPSPECPDQEVIELDKDPIEWSQQPRAQASNCLVRIRAASGYIGNVSVEVNSSKSSSVYLFFQKKDGSAEPILEEFSPSVTFPSDWELVLKWAGPLIQVNARLELKEEEDRWLQIACLLVFMGLSTIAFLSPCKRDQLSDEPCIDNESEGNSSDQDLFDSQRGDGPAQSDSQPDEPGEVPEEGNAGDIGEAPEDIQE